MTTSGKCWFWQPAKMPAPGIWLRGTLLLLFLAFCATRAPRMTLVLLVVGGIVHWFFVNGVNCREDCQYHEPALPDRQENHFGSSCQRLPSFSNTGPSVLAAHLAATCAATPDHPTSYNDLKTGVRNAVSTADEHHTASAEALSEVIGLTINAIATAAGTVRRSSRIAAKYQHSSR